LCLNSRICLDSIGILGWTGSSGRQLIDRHRGHAVTSNNAFFTHAEPMGDVVVIRW
jgi:hypothetical protein